MEDQHNPLMNDLLIAIINVIELICKEAVGKRNKIQKYFKNISDVLNNNEREKYLFGCFSIPNDEVRLALVNCILQVPLKELDIEEINYLMKAISESKNIGAGKAEEIISTIFLIFINLVKDQENSASKNFRIKYGRSAIDYCLEILLKNQKRIIEEQEEAEEKLMLSISCLYFLKEASKSDEMSKCMEDDEFSKYFYENLLSEQNYTFKEHENIPIELEYTTLGCNLYNLRETLFGSKSLDPWNKVSFRIIQQIANVLQCLDPLTVNDLKLEQGEKKTEAMERNLKKGFVKRIYSELDLWYEKREIAYHEKNSVDKPFFENARQQHRFFAHNSGLYLLTTFLTKKTVRSGHMSRSNVSYSIYDDDDGLHNPLLKEELYSELDVKAEEFKHNFTTWIESREKQRKETKRKGNQGVKESSERRRLRDGPKVINMRRALQRAPMPSLEPRKNIEDPSLIYGRSVEQEVEEHVGGKELKTEINSMIAPATVAAFLRVIYAAIKFSPDNECIRVSLAHITEIEIFKKITTLCYKAGWTIGNIGLKYLRIVRNVLECDEIVEEMQEITKQETKQKASKKKGKMQDLKYFKDKLYFYEIISRASRQILNHVVNNFAKKKEKSLYS